MQSLELVVRKSGASHGGQVRGWFTKPNEPILEAGPQLVAWRRGNVSRLLYRRSAGADHDLLLANATGVSQFAGRVSNQRCLKPFDHTNCDRSLIDPREALLSCD